MKMLLPILYTISTLDVLSLVLVITTINAYVLSLGGTQFYMGVLTSASAFINLIWNPILGSLSDSFGRKSALLYCLFISLIGNLMSATSGSLTVLFIARIFTTFGTQVLPLLKSSIDDNVKSQESKMQTIHRIQALRGFCFIFGSLFSGYLVEYENGYQLVFYVISAMSLVNIVLVSLLPSIQVKKPKKNKEPTLAKIKSVFTNLSKIDWPKYWDLFVIKLIVDFVLTTYQFNFAHVVMTKFGITGKYFGYIFASISICGIITSLMMSRIKSIFYSKDESGLKRLFHGSILFSYTCLGQGLSTTFPIYYLHLIPMNVGRILFEITFTEVILARAGAQEKGTIMGTFETTMALDGLVAPLLSGVVADRWGADSCILFCTIPLIFSSVVAYTQMKKIKAE